MVLFTYALYFYIFFYVQEVLGLSCKNDNNEDVDWFVIYKFPKGRETDGAKYGYLTSKDTDHWVLSNMGIKDPNSMLAKTLDDLKKHENDASYLFYNDEPPAGFSGSAVGHLKGFLGFTENSGFWIMHSVPKFGDIKGYDYPDSGTLNGQYAFCVTYGQDQFNNISEYLRYTNPKIYIRKSNDAANEAAKLSDDNKSLYGDKPKFNRKEPYLKQLKLEGHGELHIMSFAKDNQLQKDIFGEIIAPELKISMIAQTWRHGGGKDLPPFCDHEHKIYVHDAEAIEIWAKKDGKYTKFYFQTINDHSKWAVSEFEKDKWVCFADLNRKEPQKKRGGGALCFQHKDVWRHLHNSIPITDACPGG